MRLRISTGHLASIVAQAAATPDAEICGLLLGRGGTVVGIRPCINVAADPVTAFEIDPAALIAAHRAARAGGPAIIGCYHSHPTGGAQPSPRDMLAAEPNGWFWIIATATGATLWRAVSDGAWGGRFDPVDRA